MKTIFITTILVLCSLFLAAQPSGGTLVKQWEQIYQRNDFVLLAERCSNTDILVVSRPGDSALRLTRYKENGQVSWDSTYSFMKKYGYIRYATTLKEDKAGNFYLLLNLPDKDPLMMKFNANGAQQFVKVLVPELHGNRNNFAAALFLRDSAIVCYGIKGGKFWETAFKYSGETLSASMFNWEADHFITDLISNQEGEVVVVAKSGSYDKVGAGSSRTHLMKIDRAAGRLDVWNSFPGRNGKLCQLPDGAYALVLDTATSFPQQQFQLALLSPQLVLRQTLPLFDQSIGSGAAYIQPWKSGLLAVTAIQDQQLTVRLINYEGRIIETNHFREADKAIALQQVFYQDGQISCLYDYRSAEPASDPMARLRKKQVLLSSNH